MYKNTTRELFKIQRRAKIKKDMTEKLQDWLDYQYIYKNMYSSIYKI